PTSAPSTPTRPYIGNNTYPASSWLSAINCRMRLMRFLFIFHPFPLIENCVMLLRRFFTPRPLLTDRVPTGQIKKCNDLRIRSGFLFLVLFERLPSICGLGPTLFRRRGLFSSPLCPRQSRPILRQRCSSSFLAQPAP